MKQTMNITRYFPDDFFIKNEPMANHTTYKIGGPAEYFYQAENRDELVFALQTCLKNDIPFFIFGGGSNILVSDSGIKGVVICNKGRDITAESDTELTADSGVMLADLIRFMVERNLGGLEHFIGIPGSIGGALWINSHFLNHFIGDWVKEGIVVNNQGEEITLHKDEFKFGYEESILKEKPLYLISATFALEKRGQEETRKTIKEILTLRASKHPLEHPSAGSVFRNPKDIPAGKLIEEAGLKGYRIGGAAVSEKHGNFIVNVGGASATDVVTLIKLCQEKVLQSSGYRLETEINFIGAFT